MTREIELFAALAVSALILIGEHYWPWYPMLRRDLTLIEKYVLGVLAIILPYSVLMAIWKRWFELGALWAVVVVSGATVAAVFGLDAYLRARERAQESEEREDITAEMVERLR